MLDINEITQILPHRYPFLLVDRILELDPGKRIVGLKNVTINEPFFPGHFPGHPVMPGVLIVGAMAQVAGIMAYLSSDEATRKKVSYFLSIDKARFRRPVRPGDTRLHIRYSILVKQYSIDADLYKYWNQLKDFNESTGGLYDKIPSPVFGNVTGCDGTTKALGYFSASSVKEKRLFINRSEHHVETININSGCTYFTYDIPPSQQKIYFGPDVLSGGRAYTSSTGCADCTEYGTNVKPFYW